MFHNYNSFNNFQKANNSVSIIIAWKAWAKWTAFKVINSSDGSISEVFLPGVTGWCWSSLKREIFGFLKYFVVTRAGSHCSSWND